MRSTVLIISIFPFSVVASSRAMKQSPCCPASLIIAYNLFIIAYCSLLIAHCLLIQHTVNGVRNLWGVSPHCGGCPHIVGTLLECPHKHIIFLIHFCSFLDTDFIILPKNQHNVLKLSMLRRL